MIVICVENSLCLVLKMVMAVYATVCLDWSCSQAMLVFVVLQEDSRGLGLMRD